MSLFARPNIFVAIIFGCFAVLIPRFFLPLFRSRSLSSTAHIDDHFQQVPSPISPNDNDKDSSQYIQNIYSNTRMPNSGANDQQQSTIDPNNSQSAVTFALPMYTVGIGIFFIYTCCKYWAKRNSQENKIKLQYSTNNIQWNNDKRKFKYHTNNYHSEDDEENDDLYAGLDPDYVEYLKSKRQKEFDAEQNTSAEQRQTNHALDEMKSSLSFISSKLGTNERKNNLTHYEISQLQDRLASTEAQMYKILNTINTVANKVNELNKNTRQSLEQSEENFNNEEDYHLSLRSHHEGEDSINDEENSNSDDNSLHQEEQILSNNQDETSSSSSSYENDEENSNEIEDEVDEDEDDDDDNESESSSERYGIMNTNYGSDPNSIDDYELDANKRSDQTTDSQTKVQEWHQRNHSQSLSSNNSSIEQDESIRNDEQNPLNKATM
ncbi:unnamed protein product [Rotaria sp. Silwood1]|nr:unnamed protein product [Rotaria sp. Silwood1]